MKNKFLWINICLFLFAINAKSQCYNLVWSDEFEGTALDETKWSYQTGGNGWGNNELQYYTNGANTQVSNNTLSIIAKEETLNGSNYTSSRIRSINKGDWTYGKMEASIKLPEGQGIWPAFWMMPTESVYGIWPTSGEIDIMEYLGHQTSTIYGTCHYGSSFADKSSSGNSNNINPATYADGNFHNFSIEWEPTQIRWYVDGTQYHTFNAADVGAYTFPFDQDFHFILNVAVGGNWPGSPDATTVFPSILEVDYVRVYQELSDIEIVGENRVEPNKQGVKYTVPNLPNTTYTWSLPFGATIISGMNTNEITVDWAALGGNIEVVMVNNCGTVCLLYPVEVNSNQILNASFESDYDQWYPNTFNGATTNWNVNMTDPYSGTKSICAEVLNVSPNDWDVQISPNQINLTIGEKYMFRFWAKADTNNKQMSIAFIHPTNYTYYSGKTYTLTTEWQEYSHTFKATSTNASLNIQFGHETGTFCLDDVLLTTTDLYFTKPKVSIPKALNVQGIRLVPR